VISKKNSPKIIVFGKSGRYSISASDRYIEYEKLAKLQLSGRKSMVAIENYPIFLHFQFFNETNRVFDFNNLSQGPQDILTQMGIIPDDSYRYCIPVFFGKHGGSFKDKENPRLVMTITDLDELRKPDFFEDDEFILQGYRELAEKAERVKKK
jgi:hypothetical protein